MGQSNRILRAVLLAAAAVALVAAAYQLREKHQEAELTVQDIHDQLDALDPVTRAAVVARLTSDEVKKVRPPVGLSTGGLLRHRSHPRGSMAASFRAGQREYRAAFLSI